MLYQSKRRTISLTIKANVCRRETRRLPAVAPMYLFGGQITREYLYIFRPQTATRSRVHVSAALARAARPAAPHPFPRRPLHHPIRRRQPDHDPRPPASSNFHPARNSNRHSRLARARLTLPARRPGTPHRATAQQRAAQTGVTSTIPPARAVAPTAELESRVRITACTSHKK